MTAPKLPRFDDVSLPTAHSVRKLAVCDGCGGLGMRPRMLVLQHPPGLFHGRCVLQLLKPAEVLLLPPAERNKLTLGDTGPELMRRILDRMESDER